MVDEEDRPRAFKVEDRRRFSESGEPRRPDEAPDDRRPTEAPADAQAKAPPSDAPPSMAEEHRADHAFDTEGEPQEINFATFVLSLSTQALAHLGEIPDPIDRSRRIDLEAAQQIIDIIGMLRDKTRGNLDEAESALLENALYDLRMRYVDLAQRR